MSDFEKALASEIARLKDQLARLVGMSATPAKRRGRKLGSKNTPKAAKAARTRKKPVSAARRKQLALHGSYLGHTRKLSKANKAAVKKTRQENGVEASILHAKQLAK